MQGVGFRPTVGFDVGSDHVMALGLELPGRFEHGVGLADAGGITEKDLQPASPGSIFFRARSPEHGLR